MTLILEISNPFQFVPGFYKSRLIYRVWWLWFSIGLLRVSFKEYSETPKVWDMGGF